MPLPIIQCNSKGDIITKRVIPALAFGEVRPDESRRFFGGKAGISDAQTQWILAFARMTQRYDVVHERICRRTNARMTQRYDVVHDCL